MQDNPGTGGAIDWVATVGYCLAFPIPSAAACAAFGALQGLVGLSKRQPKAGGLLTLFSAMGVGLFVAFSVGKPLGLAAGLAVALIGGRLFGWHTPKRRV